MSTSNKYRVSLLQIIFETQAHVGPDFVEVPIIKLLTDTRRLGNTDFSLFVALSGPSHKGHLYVEEAYKAGVRNFLVSEPLLFHATDICIYQVPDTLVALQLLAKYHREQFQNTKVVAITGSNGKTMVKDWLYELVSADISCIKSPKSYNSQLGVALSLWQISAQHELGIFEAGISTTQEMQKLEAMIQPHLGLFTHLGPAHDAGFVDWEEKIQEKSKLFAHCNTLIVVDDHPLVQAQLKHFKGKKITISNTRKEADFYITAHPSLDKIILKHQGNEFTLPMPFSDDISLQNLSIAIVAALHLGISIHDLPHRLLRMQPVKMRLEYKEGREGITLINDSYNSDPESLKLALGALKKYRSDVPKWLVLSDFVETNENRSELYTQVAEWLQEYGVSHFVGIGPDLSQHHSLFTDEALFFANTADYLQHLSQQKMKGPASLLLKGARKFAFEQVEQFFLQKTHSTRLEINLSAIEYNLGYLRSHVPAGTRIMAMVKAFSYGAGSIEMARFLEYQKVDYLSVAYTDEGVLLRNAGIKTPILVLNVHSGNFEQLAQYHLEPEIFSKALVDQYLQFAKQHPETDFRYHLKIETGMHRLGLKLDEIQEILPQLALQKNVHLASAFSHLADAENATGKDFSKVQIEQFKKACAYIDRYLPSTYLKHIHNSSGTLHHYEPYFDMIRLGIALFGYSENAQHSAMMKPALSLKTHISQIKTLAKGEYVGYGLAYEAPQSVRIATLSIGYADGLPRSMSMGQGKVYIQGKACTLVGKVCMDMCMVLLPDIAVKEGDEVEVFGESQTLQQYASATGTIPYEALTRISERVLRVYYRE